MKQPPSRLCLSYSQIEDIRKSLCANDMNLPHIILPNPRLLLWNNIRRHYKALKR